MPEEWYLAPTWGRGPRKATTPMWDSRRVPEEWCPAEAKTNQQTLSWIRTTPRESKEQPDAATVDIKPNRPQKLAPCSLHPTENSGLITFPTYQCERGHSLFWTVTTVWGEQTLAGSAGKAPQRLMKPKAWCRKLSCLDPKTTDHGKEPLIQ